MAPLEQLKYHWIFLLVTEILVKMKDCLETQCFNRTLTDTSSSSKPHDYYDEPNKPKNKCGK